MNAGKIKPQLDSEGAADIPAIAWIAATVG